MKMELAAPETLKSIVYQAKQRLEQGKERQHYLPEPDGSYELLIAVNDAIRILEGQQIEG